MHKFLLCLAVFGCVAVAYGQETGPGARLGTKPEPGAVRPADKPATNATLDRARRTFQAADKNGDSRIEQAELEAGRLRVSGDEFRLRDLDANGAWNRDEFTLWYRGLLIKSGLKPAADLDAEATRVLAQQRAKAAPVVAAEPQDPAAVELEARLQRALDHLERQAVARQATREDFNVVRQAWEARLAATQAGGDEAAQATLRQKVGRALEDLERRARDGQATREEYAQLRQALLTRARGAAAPVAPAGEGDASLDARFAQALDELEAQALARQATREQFGAVRGMLSARARRAAKAEGLDDGAATELQQEYERALARLEERALAGEVTRAEFTELRGTLAARARRVAKGSDAGVPPFGARPPEGQGRTAGPAPATETPTKAEAPTTTPTAPAGQGRVAPAQPAPATPAPGGEGRRATGAPVGAPEADAAGSGGARNGTAGNGTATNGNAETDPAKGGAAKGRGVKAEGKAQPAPAPAPVPVPVPATGGEGARPAPEGRPAPQPKPGAARGG
jgi:hypothetical protein